jgi:carbonic anhydrase
MVLITLLFIFTFLFKNNYAAEVCVWDYTDPSSWKSLPCGTACGGSQQSPVNIKSYKSDPNLKPLNLTGYESSNEFLLYNNGHSIEVRVPSGYTGTFLPGYNIAQFHFHSFGEELIDGVYAPLVVHFVHKNPNETPGIAVLGVLFEITNEDNLWLAPVFNHLGNVSEHDSNITISMTGFKSVWDTVQANKKDGYVNFLGSLTTPPCTEGVKWYIAISPLELSDKQWKKVNALETFNYRPIQRDLSDVPAYLPDTDSNDSITRSVTMGIVLTILLNILFFF